MDLTILRFANFIGPSVETPLASYLGLPVVPRVMGYDPRLQLCHEDDAIEVLRRCTMEHHPGINNVAGPGIVYLSQAIRMAGRPSVPVPLQLADGLAGLMRRGGRVDFSPEQLQFLRFGRVGDITRLRTQFGYEPRFSSRSGLEDSCSRACRAAGARADRAAARAAARRRAGRGRSAPGAA